MLNQRKLSADVIRILLSYLPAKITLAIDVNQLISTKSKDLWQQLLLRDYSLDINQIWHNPRFQYLIYNNEIKTINRVMLILSKNKDLNFLANYGLPQTLPGRNWQLLLVNKNNQIDCFMLTANDARVPTLLYIIFSYYNNFDNQNIINRPNISIPYSGCHNVRLCFNPNNWAKPYRPVGLKILSNNRYLVVLK